MIKINNKTISSVYDETTSIEKIMKGTLLVYESFKKLIASGVPPITLQKCKGVNLVDYKIYGNGVINNILPSEYQQLEYIQNSGKEYIDTGIIPTNNTSVDITYQTDRINASQYIIGSRETTNSVIGYGINGSQSRSDWSVLLNGTTSTPMYSNVERNSNKWRIQLNIENGTGTWELTDLDENSTTVIDVTNKQVIATTPLNLFAFHTSNIHPSLKVYECKIYENKTLVRHFVSCYRKEDDEIGMYDLVNNVFYTNDGTGAFLKGNNTPIEVESVGEKTINLYGGERNLIYSTVTNNTHKSFFNAFEIGKTYTMFCYTDNTQATGTANIRMSIGRNVDGSNTWNYNTSNNILAGKKGYAKITFTIPSDYNGQLNMQYQARNGTVAFEDIMLVEGSYETNNLPTYEPYGYKIPVKVSGKNLIDYRNFISRNQSAYPLTIYDDGRLKYQGDYYIKVDASYLDSGNTYTLSAKTILDGEVTTKLAMWRYLYSDGSLSGGSYIGNPNTADSEKEISEIYVYGKSGSGKYEFEMSDIQLEEGNVATEYEPYIEPTTTNIYLNEPLRKTGNYVDYIDYKNKEVVRIVNKKTFDGTENWERHTTISGGAVFRIDNALTPLIGVPQTSTFMTHFDLTNIYSTASFKTGLYRFSSSSTEIVNITGDRLYVSSSNTTVEDFKEWLSINKPSIYYPIATPTKETIELPNIPLNKGTNIIEVDTNIIPSNMEIIYYGKSNLLLLNEEENIILNSIINDNTKTELDMLDSEIEQKLDEIIGG